MRLSAFVIVSIFSYICFVLSLILNILLIVVVSKYTTKYLLPYRRPLIITAIANLLLSGVFMIVQPPQNAVEQQHIPRRISILCHHYMCLGFIFSYSEHYIDKLGLL
ncbi:unnamed protein product [Nippostrongylus brasiliensis]|uniref:G_PROTEIN_RECEP_F1_2 domain-containing protein n=1 Tax=Nippostrongylus brasiliensis TaxID=27835 RepID=A0A0N4YU83_NIPBR|nr:unnamed protein product [Nippostrongylus brasiliensis]